MAEIKRNESVSAGEAMTDSTRERKLEDVLREIFMKAWPFAPDHYRSADRDSWVQGLSEKVRATLAASVAEPDGTQQEISAFEYRHKPKCPRGANCKCGLSKLLRKLNTEYEHAAQSVAEKAPAPLGCESNSITIDPEEVFSRPCIKCGKPNLPLYADDTCKDCHVAAEKAAPAAPPVVDNLKMHQEAAKRRARLVEESESDKALAGVAQEVAQPKENSREESIEHREVDSDNSDSASLDSFLVGNSADCRAGGKLAAATPLNADELEQVAKEIVSELSESCDGIDPADADTCEDMEEIIERHVRKYLAGFSLAAPQVREEGSKP